jgi:hypothetical protein
MIHNRVFDDMKGSGGTARADKNSLVDRIQHFLFPSRSLATTLVMRLILPRSYGGSVDGFGLIRQLLMFFSSAIYFMVLIESLFNYYQSPR